MIYEKEILDTNKYSIWEVNSDRSKMKVIYCNDPTDWVHTQKGWQEYIWSPDTVEITKEEAFIEVL